VGVVLLQSKGAPFKPCSGASGGADEPAPPARIFSEHRTRFFFKAPPEFFGSCRPNFLGEYRMTFQKKRFYFEADEANYLRLQMVVGKSFIQQKDFQNIVASYLYNLTKQKK